MQEFSKEYNIRRNYESLDSAITKLVPQLRKQILSSQKKLEEQQAMIKKPVEKSQIPTEVSLEISCLIAKKVLH